MFDEHPLLTPADSGWIFLSPPPPSPLSPHHHTSPENESFGSDSVKCEIWEIPKNEVLRYFSSVSLSLWSLPLVTERMFPAY